MSANRNEAKGGITAEALQGYGSGMYAFQDMFTSQQIDDNIILVGFSLRWDFGSYLVTVRGVKDGDRVVMFVKGRSLAGLGSTLVEGLKTGEWKADKFG